MSFTTPIFLFLFLPLSLLFYQFVPSKLKNIYLFVASLAFYAWSEWSFLPVILVSMLLTWLLGQGITRYPKLKNLFLIIGIAASVGLLIYSRITILHLGLSFFTFHTLSYLIDIYVGKAKQANLVGTGVYLLFFPQVAAGPINKYQAMADQLRRRPLSPTAFTTGIARFIQGLAQKMLLANTFGVLADQIFGLSHPNLSFGLAWLGVVAYTLQIYFDFAGYSDMAIGIGSLFGFKLTENFNLPYIATSITDFWARWHMSLTGWLREYIYFPLGGNRKGVVRTYINILIVFLVSGFWHGVGWHFVVWGLWHGLFMVIEKWRRWERPGRLYTILIVMIGWVFFRSPDLPSALSYLQSLIPVGKLVSSQLDWLSYMTPYTLTVFALGLLLSVGFSIKIPKQLSLIKAVWLGLIFFLSTLAVAGSTYSAFIYFKF